MYKFRRINGTGGSGWGVHVSWVLSEREFHLYLYGIQFPLKQSTVANLFGKPCCGLQPRCSVYFNRLAPNGQLKSIDIASPFPYETRILDDGPNLLPWFTMAQKIRKDGGPGEPLVDWLLDLGLPEIERCMNFVCTQSASTSPSAASDSPS